VFWCVWFGNWGVCVCVCVGNWCVGVCGFVSGVLVCVLVTGVGFLGW